MNLRDKHKSDYCDMILIFPNIQKQLYDIGYTIEYHHRLKSNSSINENINNGLEIRDIIGFRITNPWTVHLHTISNFIITSSELNIIDKIVTEKGRVIHLYGKTKNDNWFEIQLWTSLIYHCFEYEHDKIYKNNNITKQMQQKSNELRKKQHQLQDIIDENVLIPYVI